MAEELVDMIDREADGSDSLEVSEQRTMMMTLCTIDLILILIDILQ